MLPKSTRTAYPKWKRLLRAERKLLENTIKDLEAYVEFDQSTVSLAHRSKFFSLMSRQLHHIQVIEDLAILCKSNQIATAELKETDIIAQTEVQAENADLFAKATAKLKLVK